MHKLFLVVGLFFVAILQTVLVSQSAVASEAGPVIYQLQTQGSSGATAEYVSIKNNGSDEVDVTNWCVVYSSSSDITQTTLKCLVPPDINTKIWLPLDGYFSFATNDFLTIYPSYITDGIFTAGIASSSGHIKLVDANKGLIDKLGWGSAVSPETTAKTAHSPGNILQRVGNDTDNNANDFIQTTLSSIPGSDLYEEVMPVDVCPNTTDIDDFVPVGYIKDIDGNCYLDVCDNIDGLQKVVPNGYYENGIDCNVIQLRINELLPNVTGSDTGKEFIEIFNPTTHDVNLSGYYLQIGPNYSKNYPLPAFNLVAGGYVVLSDIDTSLTLPNTSASVKLFAPYGDVLDETNVYLNPADDQAWAFFDGSWQYTNQPTPGSANLSSIAGGIGSGGQKDKVTACPKGKFRNPETNRCKNIESDAGLKPCAVDQIRNPETNRCRSILSTGSSTLTPCKAGQTRNPDTNRCRKATSSSNGLKPCASNQERNPTTNRCRKKPINVTAQEIKDIQSKTLADSSGWFLAGSVGVGLAGYGVAEWRSEIASAMRRLGNLFGKNPPDA